ncbi:unnamed protein product [Microthlaspi erraticum]|uniref:Uncharacterized protein n=1 Tax=Microthlaspi erraticum TaxID=1685480 RepID=A0A6D2J2S5_9BRAS|nr:unnamed protein product [Microthlaspi erraticum]
MPKSWDSSFSVNPSPLFPVDSVRLTSRLPKLFVVLTRLSPSVSNAATSLAPGVRFNLVRVVVQEQKTLVRFTFLKQLRRLLRRRRREVLRLQSRKHPRALLGAQREFQQCASFLRLMLLPALESLCR